MLDIIKGTFKCDFCDKVYNMSEGRYNVRYIGTDPHRNAISSINTMCTECNDKMIMYFVREKDRACDLSLFTPSFKDLIDKNIEENDISKPSHYCAGRQYEPKDVIRDWDLNFNLGNVVKYVSRTGRKGDALEDLRKAKQYLEFEIEAMEKDN